VLVPAASAGAAQRYASPSGTATTTCSQSAPCDIVDAINNAVAGDDVIVEPGSYYQPGTASTPLTSSLSLVANTDVHGVPGEPPPEIFSSTSTDPALEDYQPGSTVSDLDIETSGSVGMVLDGTGEELVVVDTAASGGVACRVIGGTLTDSVCEATGVSSAADAWDCEIGTYTDTIANSDLYATGADSDGLSIGQPYGGCTQTDDLSNSIVRGGVGGFDLQAFVSGGGGSATITAGNSDYVTTSASVGATITAPGTAGNIEADPLLVNPAAGDFHETAASPTINAGLTSTANGLLDFDGQTRTEGGLTDIGADEYLAAPVAVGGAPSALTNTAVTLNATLNPGHDTTSYAFAYGTTAALGTTTTAATLAPGLAGVPVAAPLTGLAAGTEYFWKLTATNTIGSAATAVASFETSGPPTLSALTLGTSTFRAAASGASIAKAKKPKPTPAPIGTLVSYSVTEPTTTTFSVTQQQAGVKHGKRCVAPPKHATGKPVKHCTRTVTLGTFTRADSDGANSFQFTGRVNGHKLKQGAYQLSGIPTSPSDVKGTPSTIPFHIAA
jgi:hypothetical protein